jgi:hypothetical protein
MVSPVTTAVEPRLASARATTAQAPNQVMSPQKAPKPQTSSSASTVQDTVSISSAAKAAAQEILETSAQTAQEASRGDHQAQRILAREEAAAQAAKP